MTKKRTPEEVMNAIEEASWRAEAEALEAMTRDEVDAELRAAGGDPAAIRAAGAALAAKLSARLSEDALAWEAKAQARLDEVRALAGTVRKTKLPRAELLAKVNAARNSPRFAQPVAALFRKRTAEESSDEELEALLEALELLGKIEE